jgi:hypothetical protein
MTVFKSVWDGTGHQATYTDVPATPPDSNSVWARAILRHATGAQASLSGPINGATRWNNGGTVFIQVFGPVGDGSSAAYDAAKIVADAYKGARNLSVWFRNVRINEVGTRGAFEQINVLADFSYDEIRSFP